jgi:peptidoglycan DL-endopeptidase CwlO
MNIKYLRVAVLAPACVLTLTACAGLDANAAANVSGICDYAPASKPSGKLGLSASQKGHAETIVLKGAEMGMPRRAAEVAVTAALQESSLDNNSTGDGGSAFGLFQMRPVINGRKTSWGSYSQVMDPDYAAEKFYKVLRKVDGWQYMSQAAAAQAVEKSADGSLYRDNVNHAKKIVKWIAREQCP